MRQADDQTRFQKNDTLAVHWPTTLVWPVLSDAAGGRPPDANVTTVATTLTVRPPRARSHLALPTLSTPTFASPSPLQSLPTPDPHTRRLSLTQSAVFLTMENVLEKLKVLDYETTFCVKHHITPLARTSFALPAKVRVTHPTPPCPTPRHTTQLTHYRPSTSPRIRVFSLRISLISYRGFAAR